MVDTLAYITMMGVRWVVAVGSGWLAYALTMDSASGLIHAFVSGSASFYLATAAEAWARAAEKDHDLRLLWSAAARRTRVVTAWQLLWAVFCVALFAGHHFIDALKYVHVLGLGIVPMYIVFGSILNVMRRNTEVRLSRMRRQGPVA